MVEPAIQLARDGITIDASLARGIRASTPQFERDPGSARLFCPAGQPLVEGQKLRNPDLAALLDRLATDNSVAAFYHGDIADRIAREFAKPAALLLNRIWPHIKLVKLSQPRSRGTA